MKPVPISIYYPVHSHGLPSLQPSILTRLSSITYGIHQLYKLSNHLPQLSYSLTISNLSYYRHLYSMPRQSLLHMANDLLLYRHNYHIWHTGYPGLSGAHSLMPLLISLHMSSYQFLEGHETYM